MYGLFGDWVAGFGNGFTGGISTDIYSSITGTPLQPKDGFLWTMGNIAGLGTSLLVGLKVPVQYQASIGQASFWATYQVVTSGYGAGKGLVGLADGYWEFNDVFNLLGLLPVAGTLLGSSKGIAGMRASNSGGKSNLADGNAEDAFNGLGQTDVSVSGACFVAGTEVLTPDGEKSIEAIRVGDWVVADDPNTIGEIEYKQVTDTFVRHTDKLVDLFIDGEVISTTEEHPFWTLDKGWVEAKDLTVGSLVQTSDGRVVDVDGVETREGSFEVYNFKVEGFHSYFVSDLGVLVHNAICGVTAYDDGYAIWVKVDSDPKANVRIETSSTTINVTDIYSGNLPSGSGSELLSIGLKTSGLKSGDTFTFTKILNKETLAAYQSGIPATDSLLGKVGIKALRNLGLEASKVEYQMSRGSLNIVVGVQ
jgi:hypothetical protein